MCNKMFSVKVVFLNWLCIYLNVVASKDSLSCNRRVISPEKSICVCNEAYCDTVPKTELLSNDQYQIYTTSLENMGFHSQVKQIQFKNDDLTKNTNEVAVDKNKKFQTIIGFGGAFSDSAGQNVKSLPEKAQEKLLESYFGDDGIEYSLCRVPIGGTDFSPRGYSYDDNPGDVTLEKFKLQNEDMEFKIPLIKKAQTLRGNKQLNLLASAWTAPKWMKTNNDWMGPGVLKEEYYQLWADYYLKFFQSYLENSIKFWGLTTGNEPVDGYFPKSLSKLNAMGWNPNTQGEWINCCLGPTIRESQFKDLKILVHDDNRFALPFLPKLLEKSLKYIDGVGVHWYLDRYLPASLLELTKSPDKDLLLIGTEACNGAGHAFHLEDAVSLGNWTRAQLYVNNIIQDLSYQAEGWIDWNMVLDTTGGPVYINNRVDSPILVNATAGEFYKQPMFYAMGHFSKFVIPGSVRVHTNKPLDKNLKVEAFLRPDNLTSIFISNQGSTASNVHLTDGQKSFSVELEPNSINTVLYT